MTLRSRPIRSLDFTPALPGDKSITHRALLLGALAEGETRLMSPNRGEDCRATLRAVEDLGIFCRVEPDAVRLSGGGGRFRAPAAPLDLGNSGTGLRLLAGMLAAQPFRAVLTGDASLCRRPVERLLAPLRRMGARAAAVGDRPPITLDGGPLTGIHHRLTVPSAQVKTALLLAGIQASGWTRLEGAAGTRDHGERLLAAFGARVEAGPDGAAVEGPQGLSGTSLRIPGDLSAGVFYLVAAGVVPGSRVTLEGVGLNPTRCKILEVLAAMGLELEVERLSGDAAEPWGRVRARGAGLRPFDLGSEDVPRLVDELPALAVAAAFAAGISRLSGAAELRVKESDRLEAMAEGLRGLGARIELLEDGWRIEGTGGNPLPGGPAASRSDHRVAMALLIAGLHTRAGVEIVDPPFVETSDPFFAANLRTLLEDAA